MKKVKKEKVDKGERRKKWPVWLTVLIAVASVGFITGVTILGVFLSGGFEEKIIYPQTITFTYDDELLNEANGQLEVVDDFMLTVNSETENITRKEVTLSFENNDVTHRIVKDDGITYIDNGIIQVPEIVTIGQEFQVLLIKDNYLVDDQGQEILDEFNNRIDWIVGGISTLVATSQLTVTEDNQSNRTSLNIAVDVPVYKTKVVAVNSNDKETNQIVTGEGFTLKTKFYPANSEYIYSDDKNDAIAAESKRMKHSFYQALNVDTNILSTIYVDKYNIRFLAGDQAVDNIQLYGYTFRSAKTQIETENQFTDLTDELFYSQILNYLASTSDETPSSTLNRDVLSKLSIKIGSASVKNFTVNKASQTINANTNQALRVYINQYDYDKTAQFLGVNIYSTSDTIIEGLLPNIALSFSYEGVDPTVGVDAFLKISGGDYEEINGVRYYKPYSQVTNKNYCYWDITSTRDVDIEVSVVLLIEGENDEISLFGEGEPLVYNFTLSVDEHIEEDITWADSSDIDIMLDYDSNGIIKPQNIDLQSLIEIPEGNMYKDVVFFAWFGDGNKEDYIDTINKVLGSTSYDSNLSGTYATNAGNTLLFALRGNTITLQNTGSFRLYYATIVTENGSPVYEEGQGGLTYKIAKMSLDYIEVNCEKVLYENSVTPGEINTEAFQELDGEILIDQGTSNTFSVSFNVAPESVSVFQEEYDNGYMSLVFRDRQNNDVSNYFSVGTAQFSIDDETSYGVITYQIGINTGMNISDLEGIYISQISLKYDNLDDKNIEWHLNITDIVLCVYSPVSTDISITADEIYKDYVAGGQITVNQTLESSGSFNTKIICTGLPTSEANPFTSTDQLLLSLLGQDNSYVIITDQKERTDTLAGSWKFVVWTGDSNAVNLNGQTFTFRQSTNANVSLALETLDGNSSTIKAEGDPNNQYLNMNISSVGITEVRKSTSTDPFAAGDYEVTDVSNIDISKYGAKSAGEQYIDLDTLVQFYVGEDGAKQPYTNIKFQLSQQYLNDTTMNDDNQLLVNLFGKDAMLSLYDENDSLITGLDGENVDADQIIRTLSGKSISKIRINKDFAREHTLRFTISDQGSNGAIESTLNLKLMSNISIAAKNYPDSSTSEPLYAATDVVIDNKVTNNYKDPTGEGTITFGSLFSANTYYIVRSEGDYIAQTDNPGAGNYVAIFTPNSDGQAKINFVDFWDKEDGTFTIIFRPDGDNYFAVSRSISFEITRNLKIEGLDYIYYALNNSVGGINIEDFVKITRASSEDVVDIGEFTAFYSFEEYFEYNGSVLLKNDTRFLFDYNTSELKTNLYVKLNEEDADEKALATIEVKIRLFDFPGSQEEELTEEEYRLEMYQYLANMIASYKLAEGEGQSAQQLQEQSQVQFVNGKGYVMIEEGSWFMNKSFSDNYSAYLILQDLDGNSLSNYYGVTNSAEKTIIDEEGGTTTISGTNITAKNTANKLINGLNEKIYLVMYFGARDESASITSSPAVVYVPILISSIGFDYVNYSANVEDYRKLEIAMTTPEQLLKIGADNDENKDAKVVYNEIRAGQISQILTEYSFGETVGDEGLFIINDTEITPAIEYYAIDTTGNYKTSEELIKNILMGTEDVGGSAERYGRLSLNHLPTTQTNFYLALSYTLSNTSDKLTFYYLMKVVPDVIVSDAVYAYNGTAEYIDSTVNEQGMIDLESIFSSTTLHENYKRFNISKQFDIADSTELEVQVEKDMKVWLTLKRHNPDNNALETVDGVAPVFKTIAKADENVIIDLNELFVNEEGLDGLVQKDDVVEINIVSGNGSFYYDGLKIYESLKSINEVVSVRIGEDTYYNESEWKNKIDIQFSEDYSQMYYTPIADQEITVSIKHSYTGGLENDQLAIIGGEQYYQFIFNSTTHKYSVKFEATNIKEGEEVDETFITDDLHREYVLYLNNGFSGTEAKDEATQENYREVELNIQLLENYVAGSSEGYTIEWDTLQIELTDGSVAYLPDGTKTEETNPSIYSYVEYDARQENDGKFIIRLNEYISSDREVEFTLYTSQGYLATLRIVLDANVSVTLKNDGIIQGGTTTPFEYSESATNGLFEINGKPANEYTVEATLNENNTGDGHNYVYFSKNAGFVAANLLNDYKVVYDFVITFEGDKTFEFTQEFTLKHNITPKTSVDAENIIAFNTIDVEAYRKAGKVLFDDINTVNEYNLTYSGSSASAAYNQSESFSKGKENIIVTNYVAGYTSVELNLTVNINFDDYQDNVVDVTGLEGIPQSQSFVTTYVFRVYPSVQMTPNYPVPDKEQLTQEYIDDKTTFENVLDNFLFQNAIFSSEARIIFNKAELGNAGQPTNEVPTYNTKITLDGSGSSPKIDPSLLRIAILEKQNASIYTINSENITDAPTSSDKNYNTSEEIPFDANITFKRGTWVSGADGITFNDNGSESFIKFRITYQNVSCDYTVYIMSNALSVQINNASKYSTVSGSGNNVETIYVDKTSVNNLFAHHRMAEVEMNSSLQAEGSYYMIFTDNAKYREEGQTAHFFASYAQYISESDAGKKLYLDLGYPMPNFTYVGAYLVSNFDKQLLTTTILNDTNTAAGGAYEDLKGYINCNLIEQVTQTSDSSTKVPATWKDLNKVTNSDNAGQIFTSVKLANRVQLMYGQAASAQTSGIPVAYEKYGTSLNNLSLDSKSITIDTPIETYAFANENGENIPFNKNDGSANAQEPLTAKYYYQASIDIDVENKISSSLNHINLSVNYEYASMVQEFGVKHPTSNTYISSADFGKGKATLTMRTLNYKNGVIGNDAIAEEQKDLIMEYKTKYVAKEGFRVTVQGGAAEEGDVYLQMSAVLNAGGAAYDYTLLPLGADNLGDYVLTEVVYNSLGFTKIFYVVIKIEPDYVVSYGGNEIETDPETGIVSNVGDQIYNIASIAGGEYNEFTLTSTSSQSGYVSVKHKNGDNANIELATSRFDITFMIGGKIVEGVEYNNTDNTAQKLEADLRSGRWIGYDANGYQLSDLQKTEIKDGENIIGFELQGNNSENKLVPVAYLKLANGKTTLFENAKEVIFGSQYFYVTAEDPYGFKYEVYFSLESSYTEPYIESDSIAITEGEYFDISAKYESLTIQTEDADPIDKHYISATPQSAQSTDAYTSIIEISGIEAYLFAENPSKPDPDNKNLPEYLEENTNTKEGYTTTTSTDGSKVSNPGEWTDEDKENYLTHAPMIKYLDIVSVSFYDMNDEELDVVEPTVSAEPGAIKADRYTMATASELYGSYYGYSNRAVYKSPLAYDNDETTTTGVVLANESDGEETEQKDPFYPFQVPRLQKTDIYKDSNSADIQMVIRIRYDKDGVIEFYDLKTNANITREVEIKEQDKAPVRDGDQFIVNDQFSVTTGINETIDNPIYINDTLEVLVNEQSSTSFEITLQRPVDVNANPLQYENVNQTPAVVSILNSGRSYKRTEYISISQYVGVNVNEKDRIVITPRDSNAEFYYVTNNDSGNVVNNRRIVEYNGNNYYLIDPNDNKEENNTFTIESITKDVLYVEDSSLLQARNYHTARKYYVVKVEFKNEDGTSTTNTNFTYRVSKAYNVTGYYYKLERANTDTIMKLLSVNYDGDKGKWYTPFADSGNVQGWTDSFTMNYATNKDFSKLTPDTVKNNYKNYLSFTLDDTDGGSGNASIDSSDYKIVYNSLFVYDEYIKIVIKMRVSGADRDFNTDDDTFIYMDTLRLSWDKDYDELKGQATN